MNQQYEKLLNGDVSVDEAFQTIETESNTLLDRFRRTMGES